MVFVLIPGIIISGEIPFTSPEAVGMSSKTLRDIEHAVGKHLDQSRLAGAITMVLKDGKIAHFETHGWKDIESSTPMKDDTIFRIYSMTKPIVSVGVMILRDEGKLKVDDPVSKYIPELKNLKVLHNNNEIKANREVSVRDLLRHTSGMTYGFFGNSAVDKIYQKANPLSTAQNSDDFIRKLSKLPLMFQPGTQWNYSVSVDVQGVLIEKISGMSLAEFLKTRIFEPLDLKDTGFEVPDNKINRFATAYSPYGNKGLISNDKPKTSRYRNTPKFLSGGGGLVSTARDYARFCQMLINKGVLGDTRIIKASTIDEMTKNDLPESAMPISIGLPRDSFGFGLGFYVVVNEKSEFDPGARKNEYGWDGAASTHFWISPDDNLAVITLEQTMPFTTHLINAVKPIVYRAIK